uniref:BCS1 N-terminal domain-containing protein n=1 Tax=Fusarium oxysporum (strain Fo5176) TaxID=660025 RepID=A0A0D2YCJ6_FUSOF
MPASLRGTVVSESEVPQPHVSALTSPLRYTLLGIKGPWGFSVIEPVFRHLPAGPWPSVRKLITLPVERKYGDGRGIEEAKGIHIGRVAYGGAHVGPNVCTRGRNGKKSASFLSEQQGVATNRRLAAQTTFHGAWDGENSAEIMATTSIEESEDSPNPRYVPAMGTTGFWHNGTYFQVHRTKDTLRSTNGWGGSSNVEELRISCFGRSVDAKRAHFLKTRGKTRIYRPKITESRLEANNMWHPVAVRPIRPLKTVILEDKVKHAILRDMNDYLHPVAYNCEGDLAVMFTKLPRRCVVLLEDIDTAGLCRPNDDENDEDTEEASEDVNGKVKNTEKTEKEEKKSKPKKAKGPSSDTDSSEEGTKRHRRHKRRRRNMKKGNRGTKNILFAESISLSGLLNAIDGVASHEGRILIMTTNKPESLDEALVRPGRVDLQVGFKNATSEQARQLFYRMYEVSPTKPVPNAKAGSAAPNALKGSLLHNQDKEATLPDEELTKISQDFGRLIPDDMFSPAEIQGFLLKRKKNPQKALGDAAAWAEATLKQKRLNSKVATVQ